MQNYSSVEKTPICIIPLPGIAVDHMVAEQEKLKRWKKFDDLPETRSYNGIARDLNKIGRSACGNSCAIDCALKIEYPDYPRSPEQHVSLEITCGKRSCNNLGVVAVSAHVLKLTRSQKILRKIKRKVNKR